MLIAKTFHDVLADDMQDLHSAEKYQIKALEKMAVAASNNQMKTIFCKHLEQSRNHLLRMAEAAKSIGIEPDGKQSSGMMGIVMDMECILRSEGCYARDIQLICTAQKIGNYQLVAYSSACAVAGLLKMPKVVNILQANLADKNAAKAELASLGDHRATCIQFSPAAKDIYKRQKAI